MSFKTLISRIFNSNRRNPFKDVTPIQKHKILLEAQNKLVNAHAVSSTLFKESMDAYHTFYANDTPSNRRAYETAKRAHAMANKNVEHLQKEYDRLLAQAKHSTPSP